MAGHLLIYATPHPSVWQRFKAHIIEVTVGTVSLLVGLLVAVVSGTPAALVTSSLGQLPAPLLFALGLTHVVGGSLALIGLLISRKLIDAEIHTEQAGWIGVSVGWAAYAFGLWWFGDGSAVSITLGAILAGGAAARAWVLSEIEEQARERLRQFGVQA